MSEELTPREQVYKDQLGNLIRDLGRRQPGATITVVSIHSLLKTIREKANKAGGKT